MPGQMGTQAAIEIRNTQCGREKWPFHTHKHGREKWLTNTGTCVSTARVAETVHRGPASSPDTPRECARAPGRCCGEQWAVDGDEADAERRVPAAGFRGRENRHGADGESLSEQHLNNTLHAGTHFFHSKKPRRRSNFPIRL